jgi:hypothetical protein
MDGGRALPKDRYFVNIGRCPNELPSVTAEINVSEADDGESRSRLG